MIREFEKGCSYVATPCCGGDNAIVTVTGRVHNRPKFAFCDPLHIDWVRAFDGREIAKLRDAEGVEYTVSAASLVDLAGAQSIMEMVHRPARRRFFLARNDS